MKKLIKKILLLSLFIFSVNIFATQDINKTKKEEVQIGVYEQLGKIIDLNTTFTTEYGQLKTIKELMDGKSTIISLNYYECPGICTTQFSEVASLIDRLDVSNDQYQVLTLSIEPKDTPQLALKKKRTFYESMILKKNLLKNQWHFLVGTQKNITKLANSVGFKYKKQVDKNGVINYLHPGTLVVVSPSGKITRYIYGLSYSQIDGKMALIEADEGRIGATRVAALKLCFAYDAQAKKYIFQWEKVVGGVIFLSVLLLFIYLIITGRKK
jgi:protein SCO1/2